MHVLPHTDPGAVSKKLASLYGEVAFDIGANCGQTIDRIHDRFNKIVSVEPAIESFTVLRDKWGEDEKVVLVQAACTDHVGTVELGERHETMMTGQLTTGEPGELPWGHTTGTRAVPATTVDQLTRAYGPPSMLKIDTEGHEVYVLKGAEETLVSVRPLVFLEVHRRDLGASCRSILLDAGYSSFDVIVHHVYQPGSWGHSNHYWLVAQ